MTGSVDNFSGQEFRGEFSGPTLAEWSERFMRDYDAVVMLQRVWAGWCQDERCPLYPYGERGGL